MLLKMDQLEYSRMELNSVQLATILLQNDNVQNNTESLVESCNVYINKVPMSSKTF